MRTVESRYQKPVPHAVDLFCGVGGLTHGFVREGISVVAGYDSDTSCRYAYEANNAGAAFYGHDIFHVTADELAKHFPPGVPRILAGCAPCQPFSSLTQKRVMGRKTNGRESDWEPLRRYTELALELRPDVVTMENVTRLANREKYPVYGDFCRLLSEAGYFLTEYRVFAPEYGVPQTRRRLVVFASLYGPVQLVPPTHETDARPTAGQALSGLRPLEHGESDPDDRIHIARTLSPKNMERVRHSQPGGSWRDWPEALRLACHKKVSGHSFGSVYGRMLADAPAPTITTLFYNIGTGRFIHPDQDRGLTLREGAVLQSFPPSYRFVEDGEEVSMVRLGRHIGNAVPVALAQAVARSIRLHLHG